MQDLIVCVRVCKMLELVQILCNLLLKLVYAVRCVILLLQFHFSFFSSNSGPYFKSDTWFSVMSLMQFILRWHVTDYVVHLYGQVCDKNTSVLSFSRGAVHGAVVQTFNTFLQLVFWGCLIFQRMDLWQAVPDVNGTEFKQSNV